MKLGQPIYSKTSDGSSIKIHYDPSEHILDTVALNFTGWTWVDTNYGIAKRQIPHYKIIVTDNDIIAHEDYMRQLNQDHIVVFISRSGKALDQASASAKRLQAARKKLKDAGFKTRYFVSEDALNRFLKNQ